MLDHVHKNYEPVMAGRSTPQLLDVLRTGYDYVPEAVLAAENELKQRGVDAFSIADARDAAIENEPVAASRAKASMTWREAMIWLALPVLAMTPWGSKAFGDYSNGGYHRKALQLLESAFIGFSIYLLAAILVGLLFIYLS